MIEPKRAWDVMPLMTLFRLRGVRARLRMAQTRHERQVLRATREMLIARAMINRAGRDYRRAYDASLSKSHLHDPEIRREAQRLWELRSVWMEACELHDWLRQGAAAGAPA